jgi:hypothetical protein
MPGNNDDAAIILVAANDDDVDSSLPFRIALPQEKSL